MKARLRASRRCVALGLWLVAAPAFAQPPDAPTEEPGAGSQPPSAQPQQLPAGHPPGALPTQPAPPMAQGQPAQGQMPAGHPTTPAQAPQGQPGMPAGHPTGGQMPGQVPPAQAMAPQQQRRLQEVLRPPPSGLAEPSDDVPAGSVRVLVVDPRGNPMPDVAVDIGGLASGERTRYNERTNAEGVATFTDLPTGQGQAYRVNVPNDGATFSTSPFQLEANRGHDVRVMRFPVTRDPRFVFFHVFRVIAEQRGERMHIIHQAELSNAGNEAFVFDQTEPVALPEGYVNFRFQRVITDQRVEEIEAEGDDDTGSYVIRGSLPPGTVRLAWAYEMPISDTEMSIPVQIPLRFFTLQALAEAMPELEMSVRGMPRAQRLDPQGGQCVDSQQTEGCAWVSQVRRGPEDEALSAITMRLTGIPGPSPIRWFAVAIALLFSIGGFGAFFLKRDRGRDLASLERRRDALLAEAEMLEEDFEDGEIGPEYRRSRRDEIVRELAVVLHQVDTAKSDKRPRR